MRVLVISDIHYASAAEKERRGYEAAAAPPGLGRTLLRFYRRYVWLRDPFAHNHLVDRFLERCGPADLLVANGDFSCDSAFVGVSDDAACSSVREVLERLRHQFGPARVPVLGDHELGKLSLLGARGGLRLASWERATSELGFEPCWLRRLGTFVLVGVTSSLLAYPVYEPESLSDERPAWRRLREQHWTAIRSALAQVGPQDRLLLFVHDPTALPFLAEEPAVRCCWPQLEATIIGHLHSPLVLWQGRVLAGMPAIRFLGNAVRRMTEALRRARAWRPFKVRLCPSLAGIELLKDGGWLELDLGLEGRGPLRVLRHRMQR